MLVNNGADINKPMKATGRTPLHVAAESGNFSFEYSDF